MKTPQHIGDIVDQIIKQHPCSECGKECFGSYCEDCADRIAELKDEKQRQYAEDERQRIIQLRINNPANTIRQMGVPEALWGFTFAGMKNKYSSFQKIEPVKAALDKGIGVLLYPGTKTGATGNGKSRLAVAGLYHLACQSDISLDQFGFIDCARWTYYINNLDKRERDEAIEKVVSKRFLAIDDAGWESDYHKEIVRMVFRERYSRKNICLITTNFKITDKFNEFANFYRLDVFDRLRDSCRLIAVAGGSLRQRDR